MSSVTQAGAALDPNANAVLALGCNATGFQPFLM